MNFDSNKPIYKQLVDKFKIDIITSNYKPGEKILSVRDYAILFKVNPNTMNRALLELEEKGLIVTKRTSGKFITEDEKVIKKAKQEVLEEIVNSFLKSIENLNISKKEVIDLIKGD